ncbi:MAG: outer membrane beta-barrel protein [Steroidobacteraceae bacterium]
MHGKSLRALSAAAAFGLLASPAFAADNGIYLGASVGQSGVDFSDTLAGEKFSVSVDSTGFKAIAGWRFLDWLAIEGNYVDLGSGDDRVAGEKVTTDVSGLSLSAVGFVPIGPVDLFARVGAIQWDADLQAPNLGVRASTDGTDLTYGIGAQFRVWSLSLRAEYERFDVADADTVDMVSLGVTWTFL